MKSNLKKLTRKLMTIGENCAIPINSLNELNQVAIALKRAGYKGLFSSDYKIKKFRNHINDAKYFCFDSYNNTQVHPIGIKCYGAKSGDKGYMIVNWDVSKPCDSNKSLKL